MGPTGQKIYQCSSPNGTEKAEATISRCQSLSPHVTQEFVLFVVLRGSLVAAAVTARSRQREEQWLTSLPSATEAEKQEREGADF